MLDAIGNDAYNGVDLFEGTTPTTAPSEPSHGPLSGTDPRDAGVDITKLPNFGVWKKVGGELMAINYSIKVRPRDNIDRVIKRFIKKTKKLGIIDEVKERQRYEKPSDKKRREKKMAIRRRKKNEAKQRK